MNSPKFDEILTPEAVKAMSPQSLSFIGDAVQTLATRTEVVFKTKARGGELHALTSSTVNATYQAKMVDELLPTLSPEEVEMYKRGRNVETKYMAKNASANEYHKSSGLEALIGFLYLCGRDERLTEILQHIMKHYDKE